VGGPTPTQLENDSPTFDDAVKLMTSLASAFLDFL